MLAGCRPLTKTIAGVSAKAIAADAHDADRVLAFRPTSLQLMADAHDAGRVPGFRPCSGCWLGSAVSAKTIAADAHDAARVPGVSANTIGADAHDAGWVLWRWPKSLQLMLMMLAGCRVRPQPLQLMLMMLAGSRGLANTIAADAHDAGLVPGFWPKPLQLKLMMLAACQGFGQDHCS